MKAAMEGKEGEGGERKAVREGGLLTEDKEWLNKKEPCEAMKTTETYMYMYMHSAL